MFFAVETEVVLTVLAPSSILAFLNHSNATASWQRAPAHVVHVSDRVLHAKPLILFHHLAIESAVLNIQVVEIFAAVVLSAVDVANLPTVYLCDNHVLQALGAEVVFAARQESEFASEKVSLADSANMLFGLKFSHVGSLSIRIGAFKLHGSIEFQPDASFRVLDKITRVLSNQIRDQIILNGAHHLVNNRRVLHPHLTQFFEQCCLEPLIEGAL